MSYADLRTMPMLVTVVQVSLGLSWRVSVRPVLVA